MSPTRIRTAACLLALLAAPLAGLEAKDSEQRTFELAAIDGKRFLLVDNVNGSIAVRAGGERVELELEKVYRANSAEALERARRESRLTVEEEPGRLALVQDGEFRCDRAARRRLCAEDAEERGYEVEFDWTLTVPADLDLEVRTVNGGSVEVAGVRGRVEAANVNGAVKLTGLRGATRAATVNGDVLASFDAVPPGELSFASVNGELNLSFPASFGAELSAHTLNGEVLTDFPFRTLTPPPATARDGQGRYRLSGGGVRLGAGGPRLECETVNGDILIRARG